MGTKILVVDDDRNICELLKLYLENDGYTVFVANDGQEAVEMFQSKAPELVLLDIMLPKMDGWQVCREIRKTSNTPIIMLTAKGETFDKVLGLELGADDYVTKPFDAKEVMARVKAVLRRASGSNDAEENSKKIVKYDNLEINIVNYELKVKGVPVDTPPKELELIYHLHQILIEFIPVTSFLTRFGALIITVIQERLTFTLKGFVKSLRACQTNGRLKPFGE